MRQLSTAIVEAAEQVSATPAQTALAWIRVELPGETVEQIDRVVDFKLGYPGEFLKGEEVRSLMFGGFYPGPVR